MGECSSANFGKTYLNYLSSLVLADIYMIKSLAVNAGRNATDGLNLLKTDIYPYPAISLNVYSLNVFTIVKWLFN